MSIRVVYLYAVLIVFVHGCAPHVTSLGTKTVSSERVHHTVRSNQLQIQTAQGEGTISVETPTVSQNGTFLLTLRKPDSLLVKLQGPFGIKIGYALFTRREFLFYNSLENRLFSGATTSKNLAKVMRLDLDFDDLLNLFTGGVFLNEDLRPPDETGIEQERNVLTYRNSQGTHKYYIDPGSELITRIEHLDTQGKLVLEQRFLNFQRVNGIVLPFYIRIIQPKERRMVAVNYSDLAVNKQDLEFSFSFPKNAERVRWQ